MHPFMKQISVTYRCGMRYRERELADTGLAGIHTPYLTTLYRHPGISQEELARKLHVNKSSVTRQLGVLEQNGYVSREPSREDKRAVLVYPTEKALAIRERIREVLQGWNAYLTADMTQEERETLAQLMERVAQRAEDYVNGGEAACDSLEHM